MSKIDAASGQLWDGNSISLDEASLYRGRGNERLIVLSGMPDSGKTSLLIAPYTRLLEGPIAGYSFSGTRTLIGFERRCHLSRVRSKAREPDIEHTPISENLQILHLELGSRGTELKTLLLPDISGEAFELAAESDIETTRLAILRDADYVAFLIDSGKLISPEEKHAAIERLRLLVASSQRAGLIQLTEVTLLATKIDKVPAEERSEIDAVLLNLANQLSFSGTTFRPHVVSTRKRAATEFEGLGEELTRWIGM